MRRNGLLLRQRTSLCQQLPSAYEDEVMGYFVSRIQEERGIILSQISNADLTLLNIDMPQSATVKARGARGVLGAEKQCTVMLAVTTDGQKLPPYVILKRKTLLKGNFPRGIYIRVQEKCCMTVGPYGRLDKDCLGMKTERASTSHTPCHGQLSWTPYE